MFTLALYSRNRNRKEGKIMAEIDNKNEDNKEITEEIKKETPEETKVEAVQTQENKTEEVKTETENKTEEVKPEEVKTETEKAAPVQTVKEEAPHAAVKPAKKAKKPFPWQPVLKVAGVVVLSVGCGFGGGYLAGKQTVSNAVASAQSEMQNANGMPNGDMRGNDSFSGGTMPGTDSGSSSSTTSTGAALGIYAQTNTSNQVVIAGFSTNSTAQTAGLQTGDIITALDGTAISSYDEITQFLSTKSVGDQVKVTVTRDSKSVDATITLVAKSDMSSGSSNSANGSSGSSSGSMPSKGKTDTQSGSTSQSSSGSSSSSSSSSSLQG